MKLSADKIILISFLVKRPYSRQSVFFTVSFVVSVTVDAIRSSDPSPLVLIRI
jgi:hypothetical protein